MYEFLPAVYLDVQLGMQLAGSLAACNLTRPRKSTYGFKYLEYKPTWEFHCAAAFTLSYLLCYTLLSHALLLSIGMIAAALLSHICYSGDAAAWQSHGDPIAVGCGSINVPWGFPS